MPLKSDLEELPTAENEDDGDVVQLINESQVDPLPADSQGEKGISIPIHEETQTAFELHDILYYTRQLLKLYHYLNNLYTPQASQRKLKRLLNNVSGPNGLEILLLFDKEGCLTMTEVVARTGISFATTYNIFNVLMEFEIIRPVATVGAPYDSRKGGRKAKIFGFVDVDPSLAGEAQKRYGDIVKRRHKSEDAKNLIVKEEKHLEMQRIGLLVKAVSICLPMPLEKLGDLYDCMRTVGVPEEDKPTVKEEILKLIRNGR